MNYNIERVLSQLQKVRPVGDGKWSACCPAHDDHDPSLSVSLNDAGDRLLVHCHAGCSTDTVLVSMGIRYHDLFCDDGSATMLPPKPAKSSSDKPAYANLEDALADYTRRYRTTPTVWTYTNATGEVVGVVARWDVAGGKQLRPFTLRDGRWYGEAFPEPRPLLNLPDVAGADLVLIVEGETCVDTITGLGLAGVTSAGGSNAARLTDWSPLAGKDVVLLPDRDDAGDKYANTVAETLSGLNPPARLRILRLPGLGKGEDIVEWVEHHGANATPTELQAELMALIDARAEPSLPAVKASSSTLNDWNRCAAAAAGIRPATYDEQFPDVNEFSQTAKEPPGVSMRDALRQWRTQADAGLGGGPPPLQTGMPTDWSYGQMMILGGGPGAGKSTLAIQMVLDAARQDDSMRVLLVNVEMPVERIVQRIVAIYSEKMPKHLKDLREACQSTIQAVDATQDELDQLLGERVRFTDVNRLEDILDAAHAFEANVLVVDYIQRIRVGSQRLEKRAEMDCILNALRQECLNYNTAVMVISSLNRPADKGKGYCVDDITAFKESGEMEYAVDQAFILSRNPSQPFIPDGDPRKLLCVKTRYGEGLQSHKLVQRSHLAFEIAQQVHASDCNLDVFDDDDDVPPWASAGGDE